MKASEQVTTMREALHPRLARFQHPFEFKRLYPGWAQRSAGAWSWMLVDAQHRVV